MSKTPLYKMLQDVPSSGGWTLATLLDGSVSGSQLLLQAGKPVWQAGPADFMRRDLSGLQSCTATGVQLIEGQHVFVERFGAVPQLVVCGGGHVAAATVRLARLLGLPVLAIDDREEYYVAGLIVFRAQDARKTVRSATYFFAIEILSFQDFYKVLKTSSGGEKAFSTR